MYFLLDMDGYKLPYLLCCFGKARHDFPRTSCLPRRGRSIKPRAMVVPYQGLLYFCGLNQSFYMCLEETVIRLDLPIVIYSLRGFFWVGFTNAFLLFFLVSVVCCQGSFATDSSKQMLGVYEERSLTKRYCTGPW